MKNIKPSFNSNNLKQIITIIFVLLLFQNCVLTQQQQHKIKNNCNIAFGDIHNSSITSMFLSNNIAGLTHNKSGIDIDNLRKTNVKFLVLSIGIARFSMRHKDTINNEQVVDFFRKFNLLKK